MNCQKCEDAIFRFRELTEPEKILLSKHVDSCPACMQKYKEALRLRQLTEYAANFSPAPVDAERLTDKVMTGVYRKENRRQPLFAFLRGRLLRYTYALFCMCILFFFIAEWQQVYRQPEKSIPVHGEASLVSPDIKELRLNKEQPFSLYKRFKYSKENNNSK